MSESLILRAIRSNLEQITYVALFYRATRAICSLCSFFMSDLSNSCSFVKRGESNLQGWANVLFIRTQHSCILLHSFQKNATFSCSFAFFAFFYILYKRTLRFLCSFMFFIKERSILIGSFYVLSKRTQRSF